MANLQNLVLRLLPQWRPSVQAVRFRKRLNVQRPVPPHYERAKVLAITMPILPGSKSHVVPSPELCKKPIEMNKRNALIENQYEKILAKDLLNWFNHSKLVAFFHKNPISEEEKFKITIALKKQNMVLKTYGRHTARLALENTRFESVLHLFQSQNAILFSTSDDPQVSKLLRLLKKMPQLILMAGIVEGQLLSKSELVRYSTLPDLQHARAGLVSILNLASNQVISHLNHHQTTLVGHLNHHIELQQAPKPETVPVKTNNEAQDQTTT